MSFEGGPWGIVVVISAFMIQVFIFGVTSALGVLNIEFLDYFKATASEISVITALNYGVFLGSGPIVSYLMAKFSYKKTVLGGGVLVVLGLLSVPLYPNLHMMYLTVGVLVGFGSCCAYIPSHTLTGLYYDKYRSLATGVATSGSGLGYAVMPILTGICIDVYTWKGTFIILGGMCLHVFVFGALLRSPPTPEGTTEKERDPLLLENGSSVKDTTESFNGAEEKLEKDFAFANFDSVELSDKKTKSCPLQRDDHDLLQGDGGDNDAKSKPSMNGNDHVPESSKHIYIFKNYNFVIYFINNYFWNASSLMLGPFLPEYFRLRGLSMMEASWQVGLSGFGTFVGGVLGGILGNIKVINRTFLFIVSCFLFGIATLLIPPGQSIAYFAVMEILGGLSIGVILGLLVVVLADLVGIESLGNGMGYIMLSNGLGTLTGPVIAGMVIDYTGSFESSIYMSGTVSLVSGLTMCLIPLRRFIKGDRSLSLESESVQPDKQE